MLTRRRPPTKARPLRPHEHTLVTHITHPVRTVGRWQTLGWRVVLLLARREMVLRAWLPIVILSLVAGIAATFLVTDVWRLPFAASHSLPPAAWVSSAGTSEIGGGAGPGQTVPASAGGPAVATPAPSPTSAPPTATARAQATATPVPSGISPAPESPWPPRSPWNPTVDHPGVEWVNGCWAFSGGWGDAGKWCRWFGQCTWLAAEGRRDEHFLGLGNAAQWRWTAAQRGYRVGTTPVVGATVVFQPGVEGAGNAGHVAHVVAVYPDGWFEVAEMNFYWRGGGAGRIDWRYVYVTSGVNFIY